MAERTEEIRAGVNVWWRSRQDDFVKEVRGAGDDTHALYDVPAALAEYTCNCERELAALLEENKRLRDALKESERSLDVAIRRCKAAERAEWDARDKALTPSPAQEKQQKV